MVCLRFDRAGDLALVARFAFIKKTQQTPDKDLNLARKRLKELLHG